MNCPGCTNAMTDMTLDARLGGEIGFEVCTNCQAFWFALYKDLQLSAGSTLKLMKFISEHPPTGTIMLSQNLRCPRCSIRLELAQDMQRATRFSYWRCEQEHGKFIGFVDFLREKDYIHPLSHEQIEELRTNIQIVSCSHCGAPIDLAKTTSCENCGSPISLLDMQHPQQLLNQLKDEASRTVDPGLAKELIDAQRQHDSDASFAMLKSHPDWLSDVSSSGLVHACLNAVARWITKAGN